MPKEDLVQLLVEIFKSSAEAKMKDHILKQVNRMGSPLLKSVFPLKNEFYGQVLVRSRKRVTEADIFKFIHLQRGRPRLPSFIVTTLGYTSKARTLAEKRSIALLTYRQIVEYTRLLDLPPSEWSNYNIEFLD